MASPAELAQVLPDTLPEDFGEWDSGNSPAIEPVNTGGFEAAPGFGAIPKPFAQPLEPKAIGAQVVVGLRNAPSPSPAIGLADDEAFLRRQRSISTLVDRLPSHSSHRQATAQAINEAPHSLHRSNGAVADGLHQVPSRAAAAMREADEVLFQSFRSSSADMEKQKPKGKKWTVVAAVSVVSILLLLILGIWLFNPGKLSAVKRSVEQQPAATGSLAKTSTLKPSPSTQLVQAALPATTEMQKTTDTQPTPVAEEVTPPPVQSQMMNDQLAAPTRIPQDIKVKAKEEAPPSAGFGAAGTEGLDSNGAIGGVFAGQPRQKIKVSPPKSVTISAGVAGGLLIQKTPPIYPEIAKAARVSGSVVLQATISKTGTIENPRIVSGPAMLQQAALDAVKTWRFKPYRLNNEPTEVQTTVSVVFSLGG